MKNLKSKLVIAFMLLGISVSGIAQNETLDHIEIPEVEVRGGVFYLELNAETPYARGYQHGAALQDVIKRTIVQFEDWLAENANENKPEQLIQDFAENTGHITSVKEQLPELYAEMQGIADGADVDFNKLFVYQSFDELFLYLMSSGKIEIADGHCTTTGVYGRFGLPNYVTHNNDIPTYHEGAVTVLKIKYPDSDLEILQQTFAGQIGQNGVNNRGVSVGVNTVADLPTTDFGVPVSFHVRKILESDSAMEGFDYLETITSGTAMNYMIGDRDIVISVEAWKNEAEIVTGYGNNYAVHTNHTLITDAPVTMVMDSDTGGGSYGYTHQRLELATKILEEQADNIEFEGVRDLKMEKPILVYPGSPTGRTIMCMIVEIPEEGSPILYTTPDSPNLNEHVKFEF